MIKKLNIISLFDGISCGRVALERAGFAVNSYAAFEIDKYAKAISRYNYPDIEQCGDVFDADFSRFSDCDIVMGGSPCTFWSIAKTNREIDKSGVGWQLFMRFVEAVRVISPRFFLYENVASMPPGIKAYITEELGVEPILINSALVSAQQRKRLYWTNIKGVTQPEDKKILLRDIIESGIPARDKSQTLCAQFYKENVKSLIARNKKGFIVAENVKTPVRVGEYGSGGQGNRIYSVHGKTICLMGNGGGRGGQVGIYKVDLPDGDYIVRKLTPIEAERAQTLPDSYTMLGIDDNGKTVNISNTQRYKCVGNGWTVDVIAHILSFADWRDLPV